MGGEKGGRDGRAEDREIFAKECEAAKRCRIDDIVELNVGGKRFTTFRSTLERAHGSMLAALASGRHELARDASGAIFIDRHPMYFEFILEFYRTGQVNKQLLRGLDIDPLLRELDYFALTDLRDVIDPFPGTAVFSDDEVNVAQEVRQLVAAQLAKEVSFGTRLCSDPWATSACRSAVLNKANLLFVARFCNNVICGGFWSVRLTGGSRYVHDPHAFLFTAKGGKVTKLRQTGEAKQSLYDWTDAVVHFGRGDMVHRLGNNTLSCTKGAYESCSALSESRQDVLTAAEVWEVLIA
eukprot:TRINITY_DN69957_c0_g1_i1.p1 TRINITY_DN69957_c0_g1~~TRINITY_DN69957_c0_g1_i1.p1  ORF type:complete len:320 (+),score=59.53 TRINITY_DN69957_c0_g1_i1:74-961(+)